jgi:autotransporter-associated beta strand protein
MKKSLMGGLGIIITTFASPLFSQTNGTWTNAASNSAWSTTTNWSGGLVADGVDAIADFSTLDIAANRTVNLGASRSIGTLIFGDAITPSNNWTLANGTGGPWTLTLATSSGSPAIQVVNQTATVSALLGGTQGFSKTGAGALTLSNAANTLSGGISISAGTLNFANGSLGSNLVTFTDNATLGWSAGNTQDISSQIKIEDGITATFATGANNVTLGTVIQTVTIGDASVTKTGAGTLTITAANTYTGTTRISAGTLQVNAITANGIAQPLGMASTAILIGAMTAGTLEYTGSTATTLARGITVNGNGGATISNTGGAMLTLSGTQARGARPLTYSGGNVIVSGRITGSVTSNPLTIDNATVRLTHNNNSYVSPTVVQNGGTLIAANTNAASSATGTGSVTVDATSTLTGTGFINAGTDNVILINGQLIVGDPGLSAAANLDLTTSGTGSTILGSASTLRLDFFSGAGLGDNSANASAADQLRLFGTLDIQSGALLRLGNPNNLTAWADGDTFKLFDWSGLTSVSGTFDLDATGLNLPGGASLDVSSLYTLGTVTIIVPEPGRVALGMLGISVVLLRRRRSRITS